MQITFPYELIADLAKEATTGTLQFEWTINEGTDTEQTITIVVLERDSGEDDLSDAEV